MTKKEYNAKKYKENKEAYLLKHKEWRKSNPEKVRAANKRHTKDRVVYSKKVRQKLKLEVYALYGGVCRNPECRDTRLEVLTVDHINNDGYIQRKTHKVGIQFYNWILKNNPTDLQLLCYNCNLTKANTGRYPTKRLDICPDISYHTGQQTELTTE